MKDLQFGGNMYIVLVYDISQSEAGQKRWSRIFKRNICHIYKIQFLKAKYRNLS